MNLSYKVGNLIDATEDWIAHGCNARGVMGSGVARAIRIAFPQAHEDYRYHHLQGLLRVGHIYIIDCHHPSQNRNVVIANCVTQFDYGREPGKQYASYDAIESCFNAMAMYCERFYKDHTLAMPKIGAGLGGGDWVIIEEKAKRILTHFKQVTVYVLDESEIPDSARKNNPQQPNQL